MSEIFKIDLTKPISADILNAISTNRQAYQLQFNQLMDRESGAKRVNFEEMLNLDEEKQDEGILMGKRTGYSQDEGVIDVLTQNLVLIGNKIVSIEQLAMLSEYCEEVIKKHKLKANQKWKLFAAFAGIVYNLDKVYCVELHDRVKADLVIPCTTNDDFIKIAKLFSDVEAEVYLFYKDFVDNQEAFREYFVVKRDNINRVYNALLFAGN